MSVFHVFLGREHFDPLFIQCVSIGLQLPLLAFHAPSHRNEAPPEALLFERIFGDDVVPGTEALVFFGFRHIVVIGPFKEVVGI